MAKDSDPKEKDIMELSNGVTLKFATLTAWDMITVMEILEGPIDKADPFKASMVLAWRAAKRGGFKGPEGKKGFEAFAEQIPMDDVQEVAQMAVPFLGSTPPQK